MLDRKKIALKIHDRLLSLMRLAATLEDKAAIASTVLSKLWDKVQS